MTKHASGKYGRTIGQRERKAGWPAPATSWCYLCNATHTWAEGCAGNGGHRLFDERREAVGSARRVA